MSPLPPDIAKIRDELAEEHKLLTKDNGIESSNYHFKAGFNAAAEIFLKREAALKNRLSETNGFLHDKNEENNKLQANNESLRKYGIEQFRLAQKLQARNEKLVGALNDLRMKRWQSNDEVFDACTRALVENMEPE